MNQVAVSVLAAFLTAPILLAQRPVTFPSLDGGLVDADEYGRGRKGVVLAHGGRFDKHSWTPQAKRIAKAGFRVVAINFRGRDKSQSGTKLERGDEGLRFDALAAVRYLRKEGAATVSVVGASFGGGAAAEASIEAGEDEISGLVLLAHSAIRHPESLKVRTCLSSAATILRPTARRAW